MALGLGGLTKGLTGLGLPLISVPVLATFVGVEQAVLTMIIPSTVLNFYPAWTHRQGAGELPELRRILFGALPGAAVGTVILTLASPRLLQTVLGFWILAYLALRLVHPDFRLSMPARRRFSPLVGATAGALQAATGISAPVIGPYVDALRLRPDAYVFAVCICFGAFAAAQLLVVSVSGVLDRATVLQSLIAIVPALIFIPVGVRARRLISRRTFDIGIRLLLGLMACRMLYSAWSS